MVWIIIRKFTEEFAVLNDISARNYSVTLKVIVFSTVISLCSFASGGAAENIEKRPSPHGIDGMCQVCHVEPEDTLTGWFTSGARKRSMILDSNALCRQCHGIDFGHGVGEIPRLNREDLPMDKDGKIACAITCHNMHIKSDNHAQNKYHLRLSIPNLCLSCHKK